MRQLLLVRRAERVTHPSEKSSTLTYICADIAQTEALARALAAQAKLGDCFCLSGDLGAGKSTLARAFIRARAGDEMLDVPSPTFSIVQPYDFLEPPVFHIDCYRLDDESELEELGIDDALAQGICLIEWPEIASGLIGPDAILIAISIEEGTDKRKITIVDFPLEGVDLPTV